MRAPDSRRGAPAAASCRPPSRFSFLLSSRLPHSSARPPPLPASRCHFPAQGRNLPARLPHLRPDSHAVTPPQPASTPRIRAARQLFPGPQGRRSPAGLQRASHTGAALVPPEERARHTPHALGRGEGRARLPESPPGERSRDANPGGSWPLSSYNLEMAVEMRGDAEYRVCFAVRQE